MSNNEFGVTASFPVGDIPNGFLRSDGPLLSIFEPGDKYLIEIKVTHRRVEVAQ